MTTPTPYTISDPVLIDKAFATLNTKLTGLTWLTTYGRVQRLQKQVNNATIVYPGVYVGGAGKGDYLNLLPDHNIGSFSYWESLDPESVVHWKDGYQKRIECNFAFVVWFDFRHIYPTTWQGQQVSNVVQLVLDNLGTGASGEASIEVTQFFYSAENIYRGYTHREIDRQFLMKPFGGFRMEGNVIFTEAC